MVMPLPALVFQSAINQTTITVSFYLRNGLRCVDLHFTQRSLAEDTDEYCFTFVPHQAAKRAGLVCIGADRVMGLCPEFQTFDIFKILFIQCIQRDIVNHGRCCYKSIRDPQVMAQCISGH